METTIQQVQNTLTPEQIQYKKVKDAMKADIKKYAAQQKIYKANRKTVNFKGTERLFDANTAAIKANSNGYHLYKLYLAYAVWRGKLTLDNLKVNPTKITVSSIKKMIDGYDTTNTIRYNQA